MTNETPLIPAKDAEIQQALEAALIYYSGHPRRRAKFTEAEHLKEAIPAKRHLDGTGMLGL